MLKLPFLKQRKTPRIADPQEQKLVNGDADDILNDHLLDELIESCANHNVEQFRSAIESLILNMLDEREEKDE